MDRKKTISLYIFLVIICFFALFYNIGTYPLLDIDETRYADMAKEMFHTKDFLTLYLNGEFFFEKPPLYFWLECCSFKLTQTISELTIRMPIVLLSLLPVVFLVLLCRKVKNDKFAIISSATLFTSLEYLFMTKIAILDSVLTSFVTTSVFCYFATFFVEQQNKKYFWILTYIFAALAVLAKGIPGIVIPMCVILISTILYKTYKETLKYSFGIIIFLAITLPWHIIMLKMHGNLFFDEYIIKHHLLRFLGSDVIHKNQPWYFYILTILWGLFPHIFVLLAKLTKFQKFEFDIKTDSYSKFITLNIISAVSILIFFSISGAKLITYILPIYPFLAVIIGAIWLKYIDSDDKTTNIALTVLNTILSISIIVLSCIKFLMPQDVYLYFHSIQVIGLLIFIPFVLLNWVFLYKQKRLSIFLSLTMFMALLSAFLTPCVYKFNYSFGQNDLMRYAKFAKENNYTISTYLTGFKYSLLYYGDKSEIKFQRDEDIKWLKAELNKENNIVIIRNKSLAKLPIQVKVKEKGVKFSIIEKVKNNE